MPHIFGWSLGGGSGSLTKEQEEKISGVPAGGTKGQVLTKKSNTSYDDEWATSTGGPPSGAAGGDLEGSEYPNPVIAAEKVSTSKIEKLAVTGAKITKETIAGEKLINETIANAQVKKESLEGNRIAKETIEAAQLQTNSITELKINAGAVVAAKIGSEAVETAKIKLLAVTAGTLAAEAVETAKIKKEAVTEEKLSKEVQELIKPKIVEHAFAIAGEVKAEEYPGFYIKITAPEEKKLIGAEYRLLGGTSCKFELLKNKEAIETYTALEAKSTEAKATTSTKALTSGWLISLKVTEVTGAPKGLTVTLFFESVK